MLRRRRRPSTAPTAGDLADVTVRVLDPDAPGPADRDRARAAELARLRAVAAEAVLRQDEAEELLHAVAARGPLAELAPRGGRLTSAFVALAAALPDSEDPELRRVAGALREVLDHHAMLLACTLDLLAVASRSPRLEEQLDRIRGLGPPARRLEAIRLELAVAS